MKKLSDQPKHTKKLKEGLQNESCQEAEIRWFSRSNVNEHVGIAVLINEKIKFAIESGYTENQGHLLPIITHGSVTFKTTENQLLF